ncbi:glycoside hydrolase [Westerdykella ornata]|uniref:cellulase n=1 Tax=Westerdykella ornata TaxID=318751 RepID=A0A6A6JUC6_WESOR|nr:glycoside hydrolase [Westerdykella ornata]KAF2279346.1 glycoside hydrolase [Westerdykella ornata]
MALWKLLNLVLLIGLFAAQSGVAQILYAGVNSAGGEFGQHNLPGTFGIDYRFINETTIDIFLNEGINVVRLPFLLERICPLSTGLGSTFNETYFAELQKAVIHITKSGAYAILDAHNYMRYNDPSNQPWSGSVIGSVIGSADPSAATTQQLAHFWYALSERFVSNPNVIFGLMNEPHEMPTSLVLANNQASINAIRAAGAKQLILVPGNGFAGAHRWMEYTCWDAAKQCTANSEVMTQIYEPGNNFAFDMHVYFDKDTGGMEAECTTASPGNLYAVTNWLKEKNYTAFLSEFGAAANEGCWATLNSTLTFMEQNSAQWIGWTYWAAGPLWGDYFLSIEPGRGVGSTTTWPLVLAPHVKSYQPMMRFSMSVARRSS